eukprot:1809515-Pyramimonas_sp.AAC.1
MQGGSCSKSGSRYSAAHIGLETLKQLEGFVWSKFQEWCSGTIYECQDATATMMRDVEVPRMVS